MADTLKSYEALITWPTPSITLSYSVRIIDVIDSLKQSNCFPNGLMFVKATNVATKTHIPYVRKFPWYVIFADFTVTY